MTHLEKTLLDHAQDYTNIVLEGLKLNERVNSQKSDTLKPDTVKSVISPHNPSAFDDFPEFPAPNPVELMLENLQEVNQQIAHLNAIKEQITWRILDNTGAVTYHMGENGKRVITAVAHEGQQSLVFGKYKATFKTEVRWKVDPEQYSLAPEIREGLNPVKMRVEYYTNKTALADVKKYGTHEERAIVDSYLKMEYATPAVMVALNV